MSKISEHLHYDKKREANKGGGRPDFTSHISPENFNANTKEKLASTYLFNSIDKNVSKKQNKEILSRKHNIETSEFRPAQFFPWLISFLAILLLLVNIAYRGKINIKIEFLREEPTPPASVATRSISSKKELSSETKSADITPISIALIVGGRLNRSIIKKLGFYGGALSKSRMVEDGFLLFNDGTTGYASMGFDFVKPIDLSNSALDFFVKGVEGNESLELFLRDAENKSYMPQVHNVIFNKNMGKEWQFVSVPFTNFNGNYNPRRINHVGFEFGTQTTTNEPGVSIYIKNMKIVKIPTLYEKGDLDFPPKTN